MAGRILVLDDEENYAAMLQALLRQHNYCVDMATKPELAIAQLEEVPYDLVISDYKMPVMDGADFLKRSRELYPNLPVILVSGLMNTPELVKVANMGVTLVFEKPLNTDRFLKSVADFTTPMTEEERSVYNPGDTDPAREGINGLWPEDPKFFSALSPSSEKALRVLWSAANDRGYAFVCVPTGSDIMPALKDISVWKGYNDLPIMTYTSADFFSNKQSVAGDLSAQDSHSKVLVVELISADEISKARLVVEEILSGLGSEHGMFFVFQLSEDASPLSEFVTASGEHGVLLHSLKSRPLDLASYIARFIRKGESQLAIPRKITRSADAIYAMLNYDWPQNYKQVQEVVPELVMVSDGVLHPSAFAEAVGAPSEIPEPQKRFRALLQKLQTHSLELREAKSGDCRRQILERMEFPSVDASDYSSLSLVDESLGVL